MTSLGVELRVTVLAACNLSWDGGMRRMDVFSLLWIDPAVKLGTRVHAEAGRCPVWNEHLSFTLVEEMLRVPCPAITVQVVSKTERRGRWWNSLLGTTILPLAEIARIKARSGNSGDVSISQLALMTPSGLARGSIFLSISLIDSRQGSGFSDMLALLSTQSTVQTYIGYPVGFLPLTANEVHQVAGSSGNHHRAADSQASSSSTGWGFLAGLQGTDSQYYLPGQRPASTHIQTPQLGIRTPGWLDEPRPTWWQRQGRFAFAVLGGAVAGFVIGDILGVFYREH